MCLSPSLTVFVLSYFKSGNNRKEFQYDFLFCKQKLTHSNKKQKRKRNIIWAPCILCFCFWFFSIFCCIVFKTKHLEMINVTIILPKLHINKCERDRPSYLKNGVEFPNEARLKWLYESAISDFSLLLLIFMTILSLLFFLLFLLKFNLILLDFAVFIRHHFRCLLKWCAFLISFLFFFRIASRSTSRMHVCIDDKNGDRSMISRVFFACCRCVYGLYVEGSGQH